MTPLAFGVFQLHIDGNPSSTTVQLTVEGAAGAVLVTAGVLLVHAGGNILPNGWPTSSFPPLSNWDYATPSMTVLGSSQVPVTSITNCTTMSGSPPSIRPGGVVSASAFGQFTSIAPSSWIEIYGSALATGSRSWTATDFNGINAPTSLDGTR